VWTVLGHIKYLQYACYRPSPATTHTLDRALLLSCLCSVIILIRRPGAGLSVLRLPTAAAVDISPLQNALGSQRATGSKGFGVFFTENKQSAEEGNFNTNVYLVKE